MALTVYKYLHLYLNMKKLNLKDSLIRLNRYYCKVFKNRIIPDVATKSINDILKSLKLTIPKVINKTDIKIFN
jgi:hypothetical protein